MDNKLLDVVQELHAIAAIAEAGEPGEAETKGYMRAALTGLRKLARVGIEPASEARLALLSLGYRCYVFNEACTMERLAYILHGSLREIEWELEDMPARPAL